MEEVRLAIIHSNRDAKDICAVCGVWMESNIGPQLVLAYWGVNVPFEGNAYVCNDCGERHDRALMAGLRVAEEFFWREFSKEWHKGLSVDDL